MTCPSCGHVASGVECERCGAELERACPACAAHFTRADRFCRQCGRDLFFHNYTRASKLRFPVNMLAEAYEYPPDRQGLKLLQRTGPLREASRLFIRVVTEPMIHGQLLGTAVKVSEKQFPLIHRQATICERILNLSPVNIFIGNSPSGMSSVTAFTYGTEESACIFLSSGLIDALSADELRFVIGHEMGHIKSRHVLYLTIANMISLGLSAISSVASQVLVSMLGQLLSPWQRKAEITADRAGLLCCQNVHTAVSTMVKVSLGARKLFDQIDLEEYLKQSETLKAKYKWSESQETHPYVIHRVNFLKEFAASSHYRQLLQAAYDPTVPKILCPKCQAYEYLTDRDRPLGELACSNCHSAISIAGIWCPHCHAYVKLADPQTMLSTFRCRPAPDEDRERKVGVHHCGKGYFDGLGSGRSVPPESHYDVLGLPDSASERDVERAYLAIVKPTLKPEVEKSGTKLTFGQIERRLRAHRAYQVLSNRQTREDYNQRLALLRELYRMKDELEFSEPPERLPGCIKCSAPLYGAHCTQCGVDQDEAKKAAEAEKAGTTMGEAQAAEHKSDKPADAAQTAQAQAAAGGEVTFTGTGSGDEADEPAAPPNVSMSSVRPMRGGDPNVVSASEVLAADDGA